MRIIKIVLEDERIFKINIADNENISKLLLGLDVKEWEIIENGVHSLVSFCKIKNNIVQNKKQEIKDFDKIPPYQIQVYWNKNKNKSKILIITSLAKMGKINKHFEKWSDLGLVEV